MKFQSKTPLNNQYTLGNEDRKMKEDLSECRYSWRGRARREVEGGQIQRLYFVVMYEN
jgi:hypothetical protein